jgi:hypothetical protein
VASSVNVSSSSGDDSASSSVSSSNEKADFIANLSFNTCLSHVSFKLFVYVMILYKDFLNSSATSSSRPSSTISSASFAAAPRSSYEPLIEDSYLMTLSLIFTVDK